EGEVHIAFADEDVALVADADRIVGERRHEQSRRERLRTVPRVHGRHPAETARATYPDPQPAVGTDVVDPGTEVTDEVEVGHHRPGTHGRVAFNDGFTGY